MVVVETGFGFVASAEDEAEEHDAWQEGFNTFIIVPPAATDK